MSVEWVSEWRISMSFGNLTFGGFDCFKYNQRKSRQSPQGLIPQIPSWPRDTPELNTPLRHPWIFAVFSFFWGDNWRQVSKKRKSLKILFVNLHQCVTLLGPIISLNYWWKGAEKINYLAITSRRWNQSSTAGARRIFVSTLGIFEQ